MSRAFIASVDSKPIGFATIGPCSLPHADVAADPGAAGQWELRKVYFDKEVVGRGYGTQLLTHVVKWIEDEHKVHVQDCVAVTHVCMQ